MKRWSRRATACTSARESCTTSSITRLTWSTWKSSDPPTSPPSKQRRPGRYPTPRRGSDGVTTAVLGRGSGSEFHVQLVDLFGLELRRSGPLDHFGHRQDVRSIRRAFLVDLHIVGHETRDYRGVHRVGDRALAEKKGAAVGRKAIAPDGRDTLDISLSSHPNLVARKDPLQIHRQRRPEVGESRMHVAADRAAMRPCRAIRWQQAALRLHLVQIFG